MCAPPPPFAQVPLSVDQTKAIFSLCNPEADRCYPRASDMALCGPLRRATERFYHHASDPHAQDYTVSRDALVDEMKALGHFFLTSYPAPMLARHAAAMDIELNHLRSLRLDVETTGCVRCCNQMVHYAALPLHVHSHVVREVNAICDVRI